MKKLLLILFLGLGVGLLTTLHFLSALPTAPVPIVWEKEACAHCHMHIGEPRFAAQLQTSEGETFNFDDPGCLLRFQAERPRKVHAIYFHHQTEDRWLRLQETGFAAVAPTPMGYNLGAVPIGTPGALSLDDAQHLVLASGKTP